MNIQFVIVILIIAIAVGFAGRTLVRKRAAFSIKKGCGSECGCNGSSK
jgi:FeoB-associated Cys-rich membrane protein